MIRQASRKSFAVVNRAAPDPPESAHPFGIEDRLPYFTKAPQSGFCRTQQSPEIPSAPSQKVFTTMPSP